MPDSKANADRVDWLTVVGARHNNLKKVDVAFPLARFVAVTGVSGSGKSSLVNDILRESLAATLNKAQTQPGLHDRIEGIEHLDKIIDIDQSPIGRTPRSNPATYIKLFDRIRDLYTQLPEAKARGYQPGRFSFNVPSGRCEACEGNGSNKLAMDFLADVWVTCPVCEGRRFNRETLQVRFKDKSIHDVLEMDVQEALEHFANITHVYSMLKTLHDVGLDYVKLGQPSPTLSGGEAQRIKLARELCKRATGRTLYVLDEPTTGLHFEDVRKLLAVLHGFVDAGNTVVVIEHNLDVVKTADWVIDLGPEGGGGGGRVVVAGTPELVAACEESHTGKSLKPLLDPERNPVAVFLKSRTKTSKSKKSRDDAKATRPRSADFVIVEGARQHNLKDISVEIPQRQMTVFCGPSGSGKSSLAIDTLYAEGQRRYVESLSSYARQFLGQMQKPVVERVSGLSPAICIEQKPPSKSPRSTVGTVTEVYDYFRVLLARIGQPFCPDCDIAVGTQTSEEIIDKLMLLPDGTKVYLLAPMDRPTFDSYESLWEELKRTGFVRMRVDRKTYDVASPPIIDKRRKHAVEIIVDRAVIRHNQRSRIADSVEAGLDLGRGLLHLAFVQDGVDETKWKVEKYSQHFACERCGRSFIELTPNHFSFNSSLGWCKTCEGLGVQAGGESTSMIDRGSQSIRQGAISLFGNMFDPENSFVLAMEAVARHGGFSLDEPFSELAAESKRMILHGAGEEWLDLRDGYGTRIQYKGVFPAVSEATRVSWVYRHRLADLVGETACSACEGSRLRDDAAAMRFADRTIGQWCAMPLGECLHEIQHLNLSATQKKIAGELLREIENRMQFLVDVGLEYLTLARPTPTLSGGESQRIRLASQLGSGLTGVLYLLDEPTIGLHPRDNGRLLSALQKLRKLGNTLILVEHDREVIDAADYLLDFGPGAGKLGGEIVAQGSPARVKNLKSSLTGQYLKGTAAIPIPNHRRAFEAGKLEVVGATHHNLRNIDVAFPLRRLIAVTGVSGSGKSSLINDILWASLARRLHRAQTTPGMHEEIRGIELIDKVINVDQQPLGNSPSSNPATYTGAFDLIRELFAQLPESKIRGYPASRFSFNKPGGRCEVCEGNGQKKIEMHFLPDVWVECDVCKGKRYTPETLAVQFRGKSIADVLEMSVAETRELFSNIPKIRKLLDTLRDVGLDYMALGQAAPTMSGGEAQRVKLAAELARPNTGKTVYILDEPTTGLHFDDLRKLLIVLHRLVDLGNTVICIEHNLDVIKTADWIIDIGPEAGDRGGQVVFAGSPEDLVARKKSETISHTAIALAPVLKAGPYGEREVVLSSLPADDEPKVELEIADVGSDARMPWEMDGPRWHAVDRIGRTGKPARWEGEALTWVIEKIQELGVFSETNWNNRSLVEIAAARKSDGWFFHALTGEEWLLRLKFRTARGTFKTELLNRKLDLKPLDQMKEIPLYSSEPRVRVRQERSLFQHVEMSIYRFAEIQTPAFEEFLEKAVVGFHKNVDKLEAKPDQTQPWTVDGQSWHLSERGFKPGRKVRWDRSIVKSVLECIENATEGNDWVWDWNSHDSTKRRHKKIGLSWVRLMTKQNRALELNLVGPKSAFNLAAIDHLGVDREIRTNVERFDAIKILFQSSDDFSARQLTEFLESHAAKYLETFQDA